MNRSSFLRKTGALFALAALVLGCRAKEIAPITDLLGRGWKAQTVKEANTLVYTAGAASNVKPAYAGYRLDLSSPTKAILKDVDGKETVGTWTVSTDNQRLILENLVPKPSNTNGIVEFYIRAEPTDASLRLQRTAESRKTGNSVNEYDLVPGP